MFSSLLLLWAACSATLVLGAPPRILDSDTLLQNGLDAQALNAQFANITVQDPCSDGQMACINGAPALCQFGSWQTQQCSDSRQCFAVPLVKERGTSIVCTSPANAESLISAAGAKGGVAADNGTSVSLPTVTPVAPPPAPSATDAPITSSPEASTSMVPPSTLSATGSNTATMSDPVQTPSPPPSGEAQTNTQTVTVTQTMAPSLSASDGTQSSSTQTVTVTVTVPTTPALTLPAETFTLNPSDAASVLASLSARGAVAKTSASSPTAAPQPGTPALTPNANQALKNAAVRRRNAFAEPSLPAPTLIRASNHRASFGGRRFAARRA